MKLFITLLLSIFLMTTVNARDKTFEDYITFGYGESPEDIDIYRISLRKDLNKYLFDKEHPLLPEYYEFSIGYLTAKDKNNLIGLSFSPVFRYTFEDTNFKPYIEVGIGLTYITKTKLQNEDFGINFQFENLVGVGFKYKDIDISYRFMHYSNLVHENNSGVDFNFISFSYSF